jgi:hypothetical protein
MDQHGHDSQRKDRKGSPTKAIQCSGLCGENISKNFRFITSTRIRILESQYSKPGKKWKTTKQEKGVYLRIISPLIQPIRGDLRSLEALHKLEALNAK